MARKKAQPSGPPEWIVTFADMMSLLLCFFILILSFSVQDTQKAQIVAGAVREQFGIVSSQRRAGIIELNGLPTRDHLSQVGPRANRSSQNANVDDEDGTEIPSTTRREQRSTVERDRQFSSAAASIRQSWLESPEIAALSRNILMEETPEGLAIRLIDEEHRAMFPEGSRFPFERTRLALQTLAPVIARLPHNISITGHVAARRSSLRPGYGPWELSADRANAVRQILTESGLRAERVNQVAGKGDGDPLFPSDPTSSPNGRVTILLLPQAPPIPPGMRP